MGGVTGDEGWWDRWKERREGRERKRGQAPIHGIMESHLRLYHDAQIEYVEGYRTNLG
jgi:hypothetical protein